MKNQFEWGGGPIKNRFEQGNHQMGEEFSCFFFVSREVNEKPEAGSQFSQRIFFGESDSGGCCEKSLIDKHCLIIQN